MTQDEMDEVVDALYDMEMLHSEFEEAVNFVNDFSNIFKSGAGKKLIKAMKSKEVKQAKKYLKYLK